MIVHPTISMTEPAIQSYHVSEQQETVGAIAVVGHDVLSSGVPSGDIVDSDEEFKTEWAGYGAGVLPSRCTIASPAPIFHLAQFVSRAPIHASPYKPFKIDDTFKCR